ncbi:MAG: NhaP-type Na+/H+ and K+/H+ antiporters [uncultured Lysobacter sp.]|uniref:NhaP-type Na+/H+ and K+/H+ antiporters n=1 Tax=uncultured Lysobacter sp. TaxID=271060 RepID=A0A6J4KDT3_9GAMM|nr:MAG: NhaP-type Na+/H+ and K+/H+ antiporters [uncultured Lysobacter sp.]
MDSYKFILLLTGVALLGAAWLPHLLKQKALSFPVAYVALGALLYLPQLPLPPPDPVQNSVIVERFTELTVLVALLGAGIRIDTQFNWRRWHLTWRLLGIAMPITIAGGVLLGQHVMGYSLAAAALLGAVLAPTDPVLAADIQVSAPGEGGEDPVRFSLTSEAGLNDGLAFPFVWLAIAMANAASNGTQVDWAHWWGMDVAWRLLGGLGVGWAVGYGLMHLLFRVERDDVLSRTSDGLTALAIILIVYGIAELLHVYGFLAVFVAAVVIRHYEREHEYHNTLNLFAEQCERLLMALLLIGFGGALATGILGTLSWREWAVALVIVLVVRPLGGWVCLLGSGLANSERWAIAMFGVRGIGSFYYLAFAFNHAEFAERDSLWSVVALVVLLSVLIHGLSAKPVMNRLDRWRELQRAWRWRRRGGHGPVPAPGEPGRPEDV